MIDGNRGDDGDGRVFDDIGGIQPAAEPGLDQGEIGRFAGKGKKRRRRGNFEKCDGRGTVGGLAIDQQLGEMIIADRASGGLDAFIETYQVGRGVDMGLEPSFLGHGLHEGDGRALAIGAGDMDHRG